MVTKSYRNTLRKMDTKTLRIELDSLKRMSEEYETEKIEKMDIIYSILTKKIA